MQKTNKKKKLNKIYSLDRLALYKWDGDYISHSLSPPQVSLHDGAVFRSIFTWRIESGTWRWLRIWRRRLRRLRLIKNRRRWHVLLRIPWLLRVSVRRRRRLRSRHVVAGPWRRRHVGITLVYIIITGVSSSIVRVREASASVVSTRSVLVL